LLAAAACAALSAAQRVLSTPVRRLRRNAVAIEGRAVYDDGTDERLDNAWLRGTPERALRLLSLAVPLLAAAMLASALARR
jgi:predicted NAD/FAD-binding protein